MTHTSDSIRALYDAYQAAQKSRRERIRAEVEQRVEAESQEATAALARALHEAHAAGMSKRDLRNAVRAYTNADRWNKLWNAVADAPAGRGPGRPPVHGAYAGGRQSRKPYIFERENGDRFKIKLLPGATEFKHGPKNRSWEGDIPEEGIELLYVRSDMGWSLSEMEESTQKLVKGNLNNSRFMKYLIRELTNGDNGYLPGT